MVTKSVLSSPPRVRGEPIDIQEIEVELSSVKCLSNNKSTSNQLASASTSNLDLNPAAATPTTIPHKRILSFPSVQKSIQSKHNDRDQPKENRTEEQQTPVVTKPTTPERHKFFKGMLPTTPKKDVSKPKPASGSKEDAEPSVVEVQLSNSPAKSHTSSQKSTALTSVQTPKSNHDFVTSSRKLRVLSKAQRSTSLPSAKTAAVAAAAATAASLTAANSVQAPTASALKATTARSTKATNTTLTIVTKSTTSSATKLTSPMTESVSKSMSSSTKAASPTATNATKLAGGATSLPSPSSMKAMNSAAANETDTTKTTKFISPVKQPTQVLPPMTPSSSAKANALKEARSSPGFRNFGKSKAPVNGLVVRDGKLCHVRVTLAFLTGVTAERLPEYQHLPHGKQTVSQTSKPTFLSTATSEDLVPMGFAMLSQGDGTIALSHAMKPFDFAANVPRQTLIWTENADAMSATNTANGDDNETQGDHDDNESQLTHSAGQRRLYFQVSLNREGDSSVPTEPNPDVPDDATATEMLKEVAANYSPELVQILVGLKKGEDQILPLGVATLVVSGREVSGQHVDLPVRLLTAAERETYTSDSPDKKKKKSPTFRLFGGSKRAEVAAASQASFKNEHHFYSLAPNATLRVRLDVRSGIYRDHGPALWGDLLVPRPDDDSRGTVTVYDMSTHGDRETVKRSLIPLDDRHEYVEVLPNPNGTTIISSPGGALGLSAGQHSKLQGRDDESLQTRFEVTSIVAGSTDIRSTESNSENMSLLERLENAGICGAFDKIDDRAHSSSHSFTSTLPDIDPPELDSVQSGLSTGKQFVVLAAPSSKSRTSKSNSRASRTSVSSAHLNAVQDDDDDDEVDAGVFCSAGASKSSEADSSTEGGTQTTAMRSVGDETYAKVREAKQTLFKYASRVGVEMEDLLDEDDSTFPRRQSSTYSGSTSISK